MKYFDKLSGAVEKAFSCRGVDPENLKYCVKADLDGDGCYYDVYIAFDGEKLYLLSGYDRLQKEVVITMPVLISRILPNTRSRISKA